uniref:WGS project CAEQ00000000 data, annotated contig 243 n=1 Tax=Trypanosoma congolense (strain IL3000) TaxID=1068625 RepID=F9WE28_TRYCI|nr:unnamed protein product [Trypanosoma congolense IL3000]
MSDATRLFNTAEETRKFLPLGIESPFFSYDSVDWYASPYGFLTPSRVPMCGHFCRESLGTPLIGDYQFARREISDGGDWPLIGLFVANLNIMGSGHGSGVYFLTEGEGKNMRVVVEYRNLFMRNCFYANNVLSAQVEIWSSGTIVMRYQGLPVCSTSVGVVLSKTEREVVPAKKLLGVAAIRFTPSFTQCGAITNSSECGDGCRWCSSTSECVKAHQFTGRCPSNLENGYYSVTVSEVSTIVEQDGYTDVITAGSSVALSLGFQFPFYSKGHTTQRVHIMSSGVISVFSDKQDCGPIRNVCIDGNYNYAILPFVSAHGWAGKKAIRYKKSSDSITIEIRSKTLIEPHRVYTTYVRLDNSGGIQFRYSSPTEGEGEALKHLFASPSPLVGVIRSGTSDKASVIVPATILRVGSTVHFALVSTHDCGVDGTLSGAKCVCPQGYTGDHCEKCLPGHYGPKCFKCPACGNGGRCDDGRAGEGTCECPPLFGGENCEKKCSSSEECDDCDSPRMYCDCGICRCRQGFRGPKCEISSDPCQRLTFKGCEACMRNTTHNCAFCGDGTCYSKGLVGRPHGHTCSYTAADNRSSLCIRIVYPEEPDVDFGYYMFFVLCLCAVAFVIIISLLARYLIYARGIFNFHTVNAAGGAPDYTPARREREVVQVNFVPPKLLKGRKYALGVPLKQVSLHKLYQEQQTKGLRSEN